MTGSEAALLAVLGRVRAEPEVARLLLQDLMGVRDASSTLATAHALSNAFADMGLPL
jgi:hypothetical protein